MFNTLKKHYGVLILVALIGGCSSTAFNDLFNHYSQQMRAVRQAQQLGDFQKAISFIPSRSKSNNSYNLSLLEKARLEFLANNYMQSQKDFEQAYQLIQKAQLGAKIELSRGVENIAAVMSNDNAIRYDIPLYEQGMLHSYQALNYIAQHDLSGALVEVRRANLVQERALTTYAKSIHSFQERIAEQGLHHEKLYRQYPAMNNTIGNIKNGFQNAFTFYLSALLYEASGQSNDAYIDYKKALEIIPDNSFLQQDVWRLANALVMSDDITLLKKSLPEEVTNSNIDDSHQGVVFIIEDGIVEAKQEIAINLPIYTSKNNMRFYSVALPSYQNNLATYSPLRVNYQGINYQSEELVRLQSLAAKQLKDELPSIVTRQIIRLIAKEEVRQQLERKNGDIGNIFASIYNIASEKADTRSWSTLPDSIQIMRLNLPNGEHQLNLNINGRDQQVKVSVMPNKITLMKLTSIGINNQYETYNL
jgi:hypothetical protein